MKCRYPKRLLPCPHFKDLGALDTSLLGSFVLIRTAPDNNPIASIEDLHSRVGDLMKASQFRSGGVSLSLLSVYRKKDNAIIVNYKANKNYSKYWTAGEEAIRPKRKNIRYKRDRGYFGFSINDLETLSKKMDIKKNGSSIGEHIITLKAIHKPTLSNYWHCEIVLFGELVVKKQTDVSYKKELLQITSKNIVESVGEEMLKMLKPHFILEKQIKEQTLPKSYYSV